MVTDAPRTITTDNTPLITGTFTDNAIGNVTWTAGDSINIELSDESNWYIKEDIKEEPPKTYLSLPAGKRLISI